LITYPPGKHRRNELDAHAVAALRRVLDHVTPDLIVLSSQRRLTDAMREELDMMWSAEGLRPFDATTLIYPKDGGVIARAHPRGQEVAMWLSDNPHITRWAVVDDDLLNINGIIDMDRVVICNPAVGLTPSGAERIIHILTNDVPTPTPPLAPVYADSDL
jgi:hypothetical protein